MKPDTAIRPDRAGAPAEDTDHACAGEIAGRRPSVTDAVTRGVVRHLVALGLAPLLEITLPNGRRADIAALDRKGRLTIVEVKSCAADFLGDTKWADYLSFCDAFYFAVDDTFPRSLLPEGEGLIIADAFDAAIVRDAANRPLAAARRRTLTVRFARQAAGRMVMARSTLLPVAG